MPNAATLHERRLRMTKAQLIDEIDSCEQRVTALEVLLEKRRRVPQRVRNGWAWYEPHCPRRPDFGGQ